MTFRKLSLVVATLVLVACSEKSATDGGKGQAQAPAKTGGSTITVKGSDTMVILGQRLAEDFMKAHPGMTVQVTGGGSGTGVAALINGTTDIANASREMKDSEKAQVQKRRGGPAVETRVALDGLAVYVNESNPLKEISLPQLKEIYLGNVRNWKELGGADARIVLYGRENNSGTYAYFKEKVLDEEDFAAETQTLPGTAAVVNAVSKDPNAIGYGGIAYDSGIRAVAVKKDASSEAVLPSMEKVVSGEYPISRFLFMYTVGEPQGNVKAFIDFALSPAGQEVASKVGYYPLPKSKGAAQPSGAGASPAPAGEQVPAPADAPEQK